MDDNGILLKILDEVQGVKQSVERLDTRIGNLEQSVERLDTKVDKLDTRVGNLEQSVEKLDTKVDKLEVKVDNLDTKVDKLEVKVDNLDTKVERYFHETVKTVSEIVEVLDNKIIQSEKVIIAKINDIEDVTAQNAYDVQLIKRRA